MVDASVQAVIEDPTKPLKQLQDPDDVADGRPMPFEIKTGKVIGGSDHRAQTMLYTLLMEDRYREFSLSLTTKRALPTDLAFVFSDIPIDAGLLYYTQTDSMVRVPALKNEIRSLLKIRNELAGYQARTRIPDSEMAAKIAAASQLGSQRPPRPQHSPKSASPLAEPKPPVTSKQPELKPEAALVLSTCPPDDQDLEDLWILPPTIDDARECKSCSAVDACMLYRRVSCPLMVKRLQASC